MAKLTFLMENWYLLIVIAAAVYVIGYVIGKFFSLPTSEQRDKVKEWLLWAVIQAEKELGNGTGQLKLRQVYDLFLQRFPAIAKAISFDTFMIWVDEVLEDMRNMLNTNEAVWELVNGVNGVNGGASNE